MSPVQTANPNGMGAVTDVCNVGVTSIFSMVASINVRQLADCRCGIKSKPHFVFTASH